MNVRFRWKADVQNIHGLMNVVCFAEANGTRIGQAFSRQKLEDLERDIRDKCF